RLEERCPPVAETLSIRKLRISSHKTGSSSGSSFLTSPGRRMRLSNGYLIAVHLLFFSPAARHGTGNTAVSPSARDRHDKSDQYAQGRAGQHLDGRVADHFLQALVRQPGHALGAFVHPLVEHLIQDL